MYILDTKLNESKVISIGLTKVYGIGLKSSSKICKKLGLSQHLRVKNIPQTSFTELNTYIISKFKLKITNELRRLETFQSQKLLSIKCYRALRKIKGLPVRGQRTHTNGRTAKKYKIN